MRPIWSKEGVKEGVIRPIGLRGAATYTIGLYCKCARQYAQVSPCLAIVMMGHVQIYL